MYQKLKNICKAKGINVTQLCTLVTGSSGNLATWKKGYMRSDYLAKAADILTCSTDYILDRTDDPNCTSTNVKDNDDMNINQKNLDKETIEIAEMIKNLSLIERSKVVLFIEQISKQKEESLQYPDIQISKSKEKALARDKNNPFHEAPTSEQIKSFAPVPEDTDL